MEGLDSGGLATDPLLSAALSSPLGSSREDLFLHDFARSSPHPGTLFGYFFPPSSQPYNYNVNIKYEYDLKNEDDSNESPPGHPPCSTPSEYVQSHVSQANETNFSSASFVPAYSGLEIRSPKSEKECFFNGYTNGKCDMDDEVRLISSLLKSFEILENFKNPIQSVCLPKNCSPTTNGQESLDGDEEDDGEELNTKDLAQRISAELKRYSIPQAIFAQKILCRSQGTLSDLLRNPKPWSKLKSGRETFRRMAKWLQEPEFKRMSDLRMAGQLSSTRFYIPVFAFHSVSFSLSVSPFTSLLFSLCLSLHLFAYICFFLSIALPQRSLAGVYGANLSSFATLPNLLDISTSCHLKSYERSRSIISEMNCELNSTSLTATGGSGISPYWRTTCFSKAGAVLQ
ncbi:unnamed protein product [Angiostrongylus costaricensis]|uniref:CUT domain-containing protein n=1 Tax=Angiostrongylus costaricensis TaxID=334426 RepID=A0A0R3PXB6_ANGCS|nr:unnamed protein product [Angiostrongylus costaricensis]